MVAQARPGLFGTVLAGFTHRGGFNQVRDQVTQENLARQMLPYELTAKTQALAYGQGIQDPALRNLYFTNPAAYAEVEKSRLSPTKVAQNEKVFGGGPNGDQTLNGSVISKPSEIVGDTAGAVVQRNPAAPIPLAPSQSLANGDTAQIMSTAPAAPILSQTPAGVHTDLVYPSAPGSSAPRAASGSAFDLSQVQQNPTAFFSGVFGKPVTISSGARTPQQNAAVGGVPNSAHLSDQAWDIPGLGLSAQEAAARLKSAGVPFDQVIDEGDHLHVSLAPSARGMLLAGSNGRYRNLAPSGAPPSRGPSAVVPIRQGGMPQQLVTPQERAAAGISPSDRAGYARKPNGEVEQTAQDPFGPERQMAYTKSALEFEPLKNYITTRGFLDAAQQSMKQKGGFADLNLIDMAGKSVNPTLAMRPNMIEQFGKERGWTDEVIGKIRATMEHGQALDDAARNALYNTIYTNTKAHYNASKGMIDKIKRDASKYGLTPQDLIPDLQEMPEAPAPAYGGSGSDQAIAAARDAIRRGAPRAAVIQRLRQNGINPAGL